MAIIFFVKPKGSEAAEAGTFIYRLPVNQSFTCEAGCGIWGFPKTVEEIDIDYADDRATGKLVMDGRHVLTLTVPRQRGEAPSESEAPSGRSWTYTYIDGVAHRTPLGQGGGGRGGGDPSAVRLELGDHALADELRGLGLPELQPVMTAWTEHMTGVFEVPEKL